MAHSFLSVRPTLSLIRWIVRSLPLSLLICGALGAQGAQATFYTGHHAGSWAEIEIRNGFIRSYSLELPSTCRSGSQPSETKPSKLTMRTTTKLRIRKHGGFFRESVTRWSKSVLKGRVIGGRIRGFVWFADMGDYVQCWTGTGKKPDWVQFNARRINPR
jgi:hypothetical protein